MIEYDFKVLLHVIRGLASPSHNGGESHDCRAQPVLVAALRIK